MLLCLFGGFLGSNNNLIAYDLIGATRAFEQFSNNLRDTFVLLVQNNLAVYIQIGSIVSNGVVTYSLNLLKRFLQGQPFIIERHILCLKRKAAS